MARSLAILAIALGTFSLAATDASAGGSSYYSYRNSAYRLPHTRSYSHGSRAAFSNPNIGYSTRGYNRTRSYSTGYSRSTSYSLQSSPYYSSPYQSRSSMIYRKYGLYYHNN